MMFTNTLEGDRVVADAISQIVPQVKDKCKSLVLFGSFGKGEGLVLEGEIRNDLDLLVVDGKDVEIKHPMAEVHHVSSNDLKNAQPTQQWWEIKYASHLLYGDRLNLPVWESYEIPYEDAVNSLNRRVVSMLVGKHEMMKEQPDWRKVLEQINKMIIALGDATLIKRGLFHPRYSVRSLMLLNDPISGLYQMAVSTKTLGQPDLTQDQIWAMWNQTRNAFREYVIVNQVDVPLADALMATTDQTSKEELEEVIKQLGAGEWL